MLVGHYSVALGLKKADSKAPLGLLFLAVQLADILFFPLTVVGIERGSIVPGITEASDLRLDYAPFTHGLLGAVALSVIVYGLIQILPIQDGKGKRLLGVVIAAAVFSHYVLDVVVHVPDMALVNGGLPRIGLGLWQTALGTFLVEAVILAGGLWLYLRATEGTTYIGKYGMIQYVLVLVVLNFFNLFQPPPDSAGSIAALTVPALILYGTLAAIAFWLDGKRTPRTV